MTNRKRIIPIILFILVSVAAFVAWRIFGSNTNFSENKKYFYIKTGSNFDEVIDELAQQKICKNPGTFKLIAKQIKYNQNGKLEALYSNEKHQIFVQEILFEKFWNEVESLSDVTDR